MTDTMDIYNEDYYLNLPVDSDRINILLEQLELTGEDRVCEIGCAAGHFLAAIADRIGFGVGIDTADAAIRAAQHLKDKEQIGNIEFKTVSAEQYAGTAGNADRFDYVFLMDVTEHIDDAVLHEVLMAAHRLLTRDGRLVIHTPNLGYWLERLKDKNILPQLPGHIAVRNLKHYELLLEQAGFEVIKVEGLPHYRQPLRQIDLLLKRIPGLGRLFLSRLFVVSRKRA